MRRVFMVGAFPPPVHGLAMINAAVSKALRHVEVEPIVIDLAPLNLDRSPLARFNRLPRVLRGLGTLMGTRGVRGSSIYMSVSGGLGQMYELAFIVIARVRRMHIFLHHHSFAYLDDRSILTSALVRRSGSGAVHVALSPEMGRRLQTIYGPLKVVAVSNTTFLASGRPARVEPRQSVGTLGFISNISAEKGIFEFLDVMDSLAANDGSLTVRLAGPFQDAETEHAVRERLRMLPRVEYVGPQYGAAKALFYDSIDVLIFPTRYVNEAEPVTVHEAMSCGIPVIAYGRGCIPEIIGSDCGLVIDPAEPFVPAAIAQLQRWITDPTAFRAASKAAAERFSRTFEESEVRWQGLLQQIIREHVVVDRLEKGKS